jgi:hypothetical protein
MAEGLKDQEKRTGIREYKISNLLMGRPQESITIRTDCDDVVELSCHCQYDPALVSAEGNKVLLLRKVEIQSADGNWNIYPSVVWLDGVQDEEQLVTRALIKKTGKTGFYTLQSSEGVPDGTLCLAAEAAGIHMETIDG